MNEYTVANARKIYNEINDIRPRCVELKVLLEMKQSAEYRKEGKELRDQVISKLGLLADYPWYVRIWARLTYKI